jgi:hypothetical protein
MVYNPIPYASEQGIYFALAGNLNRAIREFIRLIRESSLDLLTCGQRVRVLGQAGRRQNAPLDTKALA